MLFLRKKILNQNDGFREMKHLKELSTCFFLYISRTSCNQHPLEKTQDLLRS